MAIQSIQEKVKENPYIGPRPFGRNLYDQLRFFGRSYETEEILTQILSHQLVLIYAQSGAGKTSILNANVIPELEKEGFKVLPIARVGISSDAYVNVENGSKEDLIVSNHYMFNALWSIKPDIDSISLLNKSFTDFIGEYFSSNKNDNDSQFSKVIIFDQLEELFSIFPKKWYEEQIMFFKQITDALKKDPHLRIVFVIREDYLAQLDPFSKILPEKLRPRFRLERLRKDAAIQAIKGPLERANYDVPITEIEQIVQDLMKIKVESITGESIEVVGEFTEPIHLQVVCQRWWYERFVSKDIAKSQSNLLSSDLTNVDKALEDFYEKSLDMAVRQTHVKEDDLRRWCEENLITSSATRSIIHLESGRTKGINNKAIEILANSYLIRREWRSGAPWYELTHDRLINPIKNSNKDWFDKKLKSRKAFRIKIFLPIILISIVGISLFLFTNQTNIQEEIEQQRTEIKQEKEVINSSKLFIDQLTSGINYLGQNHYDEALTAFDKALTINPISVDALLYKGSALSALGNYTEAIEYYDKALMINPTNINALSNKGLALSALGNYTEAIEYYDKALMINPTNINALSNKGLALSALGNYTEAIEYYDKALMINPTNINALSNKGLALSALGNYTEAIEYYDEVLMIDPTNINALNNKGIALVNLGRYSDKVLSTDPKNVKALYGKGLALSALGNYTEAIEYYDKVLMINPTNINALSNKGLALSALDRYKEAIEYYDKVLEIDPTNIKVLSNKGLALSALGNYTEAIEYYDKALMINPTNINALNNKGIALVNLGHYQQALNWYDKALEKGTGDLDTIANKARILVELDKYSDALKLIDQNLKKNPVHKGLLCNKAEILEKMGYKDMAIPIKEKLQKLYSENYKCGFKKTRLGDIAGVPFV